MPIINNRKICLLTNDVETTSIVNGGLRNETGVKVFKDGMPRLLDLYEKFNIKTTFFFVADFAENYPEIVKMVQPYGHEVACHGLTHDYKQAFDLMTFKQQKEHLTKAKQILEDIAGVEVVSFRAPALRVNKETPKALIETGFKFDSSIAPQRMDLFMSLGSTKKLNWLAAPRKPYFVSENNLARKGNTQLLEVPISSFVFPYIGTFMRISPTLNQLTRYLLYFETKESTKPINFLIHPNELISEDSMGIKYERHKSNYIAHLLSDVLRNKMKRKNLGIDALNLYEKEIKFWDNNGYNFCTIKEL
jgi:peptidoglycan-N-acetylglucosamine deacetylase